MLHIRAPSPSPPLASADDAGMSGVMATNSPISMPVDFLSPVQRRPSNATSPNLVRSTTLTSANGIKIRSRTTSRTATTSGTALGSTTDIQSASPITPIDGQSPFSSNDRSTSQMTANSVHTAPIRTYQHGVYGNNPDRRMCESAVEIMSVVREGDESSQHNNTRRSASDRPQDWRSSSSSADCTPVKRAAEKGYPGIGVGAGAGSSAFSDSEVNASSDERLMAMSESGLPMPAHARAGIRLRQSVGQSSSSAGNRDLLGGNSPRLVRKRLSADRPVPTRSNSTGLVPSTSSRDVPSVPFPQAPPLLIRARTSVGPAGEDINEDTEVSSTEDGEPIEQRKNDRSPEPNEPDLPFRPRQHKRWNSEVHETSSPASRLSQDPVQPRTRHNSFMPSSGQNMNESRPASGEFRRRAPDRRQSMDASRQRLVVREPGKIPITYQLGECIGRGQFGSVYRALNIHTGSVVAVKRIRLAGKTEEEANQLQKEVDLLKRLSHPSVVKYEGLVRTEHYLNIVMEYVENGSLHNTLGAFGILPEALVASYVVKILEGLSYLHRMQVCDKLFASH